MKKLLFIIIALVLPLMAVGQNVHNGYEYVDLGFSVKWATCNVGASNPWEYGGYYQWAGTNDVKSTSIDLSWSNCPYHTGSNENTGWTKYVHTDKYSYWSDTGSPDGKTVLDPEDDVAHVNWGGDWRMPTEAEWMELVENCSWTWTTINGINGYQVKSKKPGYTENWIFLPAAGCRYGGKLNYVGSNGNYWSSSLYTDDSSLAYRVSFYSSSVGRYDGRRYYGRSVRPVTE